ncbi:hypothetical protein [Mesorhizobium erdmanii]|uniref:hypothetical protein n=1 Tax=Mesorhizobium erdmanii TaxID=1777866 RepID=UPI000478FABC|nr:hypothetical protein [Mesorhizobium erdmanii]
MLPKPRNAMVPVADDLTVAARISPQGIDGVDERSGADFNTVRGSLPPNELEKRTRAFRED